MRGLQRLRGSCDLREARIPSCRNPRGRLAHLAGILWVGLAADARGELCRILLSTLFKFRLQIAV